MFTNDREAYRRTILHAWQKYQKQLPLEPTERQIVDALLLHPEYQNMLDNIETNFAFEENPYLHLSLHISVQEQLNLDKPKGIANIYQALQVKFNDKHIALHAIMVCLKDMLWEAQQTGTMPDEQEYLQRLNKLF